jgi:type IV pilus assembly protein PilQ
VEEPRLTMDFRNTPAPDLLRALATLTGINVVVDPSVQGALTLTLNEVTLEEALQAIARAANLHVAHQENVYLVSRNPIPKPPKVAVKKGRVTIDVENYPLPDLLRQVAAQAGLSLLPEADVQGNVTLHAEDLPLEAALAYLLEAHGLEQRERDGVSIIAKKPPPEPAPPPGPKSLVELAEDGCVTLDLEEQPLPKVLRQLAEVGGLNIVPQPDVQGNVTLRLRGVTAEAALQVLLKTAGLTGEQVEGVWIVAKSPPPAGNGTIVPDYKQPPPFRLEVAEGKVTLDAEEQPVAQILRELAAQGELNIVPEADVPGNLTVHLQGVPVETALQVILKTAHLKGTQEGEVWLVSQAPPAGNGTIVPDYKPPPFRVEVGDGQATLDVQDQPVKDVLRRLGELGNLNVVPEADLAAKVTLHLEGVPVETAFRVVVDLSHLQARPVDGIWEVYQQIPPEPVLPPLVVEVAAGKVTLEAQEQPLGEVLRRLARAAKLNLLPDPALTQSVSLHLHGVSVEEALEVLTETYHLSRREVGEVLLLAQAVPENGEWKMENGEGSAGAEGSETPVSRPSSLVPPEEGPLRPPDRVRLDVQNASLAEVLATIRDQTGAQIILTEGIRKLGNSEIRPSGDPEIGASDPVSQLPDFPVSQSPNSQFAISLRLDDVTVEEALETVLRGTGYTFREIDGRYYLGRADDLQSPAAALFVTTGTVPLKYLQAQDAVALVSALIPKDRVQALPEQNALLVVGTDEQIRRVREEMERIDQPTPQIRIETLLVELSEQASRELGAALQWGEGPWRVRLPLGGDLIFRDTGGLGDAFEVTLRALLEEGKATVLANPSVAVVNGQTAHIHIDQLRYFRTGTLTPGTTGTDGTGDGGQEPPVVSPYYPFSQIDRVEAGIKLEITPWVGATEEITVQVTPEVSGITGVGPEGLPEVNRRTATTTLRVKDGESLVMGGLRQQEETKAVSRTPILSEWPLIGPLFRQEKTTRRETELVIVLTPHLLGKGKEGKEGERGERKLGH